MIKYINLKRQYDSIKGDIERSVLDTLRSGKYILGSEVENFEKSFAKYCGTRFAIGVANGTDALVLALKALGVKSGDEVITQPNSFISTAGAIIQVGAIPVFVDVKNDFTIDPKKIEKAISSKTKAIIPVHLTGKMCDMDAIMTIAKEYDLKVIEDAAQAVGAIYHGKKAGSIGDVGCFSLHPLKNLNACGDAGIITTNNEHVYDELLALHNHGLVNRDTCENWGMNSRLDSLQASILDVKLSHLDVWTDKIRCIAKKYQERLEPFVLVPKECVDERPVYHTFIIQSSRRNDLQKYLSEHNIGTKIHYPIPIHLQPAARSLGYKEGDFPLTEKQASQILSIPIYPELTDDEVEEVIDVISNFFTSK